MTFADRAIIVLALGLLGWLYGHYWGGGPARPGAVALIRAGDNPPIRVDLERDQVLHVHGSLGESVLEVRDGRVRFTASPCANQACVHTGWLGQAGEFAACLPNRVSVQVEETEPAFDSVVF